VRKVFAVSADGQCEVLLDAKVKTRRDAAAGNRGDVEASLLIKDERLDLARKEDAQPLAFLPLAPENLDEMPYVLAVAGGLWRIEFSSQRYHWTGAIASRVKVEVDPARLTAQVTSSDDAKGL
jgi:hypothetical protein